VTGGAPRARVAFVIQRYGPEIAGGSEALARGVARRLSQHYDISVLTTCARDYVTWRNELPVGRDRDGPVEVWRYPVTEERDLAGFNAFSEELYARPHTLEQEMEWLRRQGPHAPALVEDLRARAHELDAVVFFTYLYYPTVMGLEVAADRSVLVPTAHDEPPLGFAIYQTMFRRARAFAFCSAPEAALVEAQFGLAGRPSAVAGIGIDPPAAANVEALRRRYDLARPYALYAGRIDAGKGCAEMLDHYGTYRRGRSAPVDVALIGKLAMAEPRQPGVRYLGFLSEEEKAAAMAGARAIVCPSRYESLSIVLLEGFAAGVPGLVNGRSPVLKDHCLRSNGGLYYEDGDEFAEALDLLATNDGVAQALGANGREYVDANYRWDMVLERYRTLIEAVRRPG
jgi:glycosyltransferase involved in cell wall biosynthesis